jgi:hypothetical protein
VSVVNTRGKIINLSLLAAVYIIGIIGGVTLFLTRFDAVYTLNGTQILYTDYTFIQRTIDVFTPAFLALGVIFLLGFGSIFSVFVPLVLLVKGLGTGLTLAHIYTSFAANEMLKMLIIIIPYAVFSTLVLIVGCREAMRMSVSIFKITISCGYLPVDYKLYINKFIILTAILIIGAVVNTFICGILIRIFV